MRERTLLLTSAAAAVIGAIAAAPGTVLLFGGNSSLSLTRGPGTALPGLSSTSASVARLSLAGSQGGSGAY
jgi:hypothetical protein